MATNAKNAIFNLMGSLCGPLIGLVMTPFYLSKIGLDGLGLVGLMTLITTTLGIFVAGISKTYQRDISNAMADGAQDLSGLVKGGILLFTLIGIILGLLVAFFGQFEIRSLAATTSFSYETLQRSLILISLILCVGVASGGIGATLVSFRDQAWPNIAGILIGISIATCTWLALNRWPSVDVFYTCQAVGALISLLFIAIRCGLILRRATASIPQSTIIAAWRKKIGVSGKLSLVLVFHEGLGVLISQIDRILITGNFPLAVLGAYNLGANPARFINIFTGPINTISYPDLCQMVRVGASSHSTGEYLGRLTFFMTLLFACGMIALVPGAQGFMTLWLGASNVPEAAPTCLILLSASYLLLGIAGPFYNLTVAHGKATYGIPKNILSLLILPPIGLTLGKQWGVIGVACVPIIYSLICIAVCGWMAIHRLDSTSGFSPWLKRCLLTLVSSAAIVTTMMLIIPPSNGRFLASSSIALVFALSALSKNFGLNPKGWMNSLECQGIPGVTPLAQSPSHP